MNHLDLFSGIGGFALAARWMGWETKAFCDSEPYCQKLLKQNFPNTPVYEDIRTIPFIGNISLITGGAPCQPFSQAGKQGGKEDDRYLWPQMLRVITQEKPAWVVFENVVGIIPLALDTVLTNLETEGYSAQSFVIPACGVDAPHRRDRVWVVANTKGKSRGDISVRELQNRETWVGVRGGSDRLDEQKSDKDVAYPKSERTQGLRSSREQKSQAQTDKGLLGRRSERCRPAKWEAEPRVGRVVDGFSGRVDRIKALGNAIVPQLAHQIFKHIERFTNERQITLV